MAKAHLVRQDLCCRNMDMVFGKVFGKMDSETLCSHLTDTAPIPLPDEGTQWIDQPLVEQELTVLRTCVNRQQPFGTPEWQQQLATALGLESTLRRRGRLPKLTQPVPFSPSFASLHSFHGNKSASVVSKHSYGNFAP